jgi:hypothetical protein
MEIEGFRLRKSRYWEYVHRTLETDDGDSVRLFMTSHVLCLSCKKSLSGRKSEEYINSDKTLEFKLNNLLEKTNMELHYCETHHRRTVLSAEDN